MRGDNELAALERAVEDFLRVYLFDEDNIEEATDEAVDQVVTISDDYENREKRLANAD